MNGAPPGPPSRVGNRRPPVDLRPIARAFDVITSSPGIRRREGSARGGTMKIAVAAAFVVATVPGIAEGVAVPAGTYVSVPARTTDARVHGYRLSKEGVPALLPGAPFDGPA